MKSPSAHNVLPFCAVLTALWITSAAVQALPDDRNQPIQIQANSADRSAKTGVTTYSGNVDIRQGSIRVTADTVVLNSDKDELTYMVATGKPATYNQQLTSSEDIVDAKASQIHFDVQKDTVILDGNGSLKQKGGSITGEHIEYDIKAEHVKALAAESGSADNSKRITVVIPPNKKQATSVTPLATESTETPAQ